MWFRDELSGSIFFYETNQLEVGGRVMPENDKVRAVIASVQDMKMSGSCSF